MAKRFTDTGKWSDPWYRALSPVDKLAWGYLTDNCDPAGIIDLDRPLADFQIGQAVDWSAFIKAAGDRIVTIAKGKLWLAGFIYFQYGTLSQECNPHRSVIATLEKHNLYGRVLEGYLNPTSRVQDKDQDKEQDKEQVKEGGVGETKPPPPTLPPTLPPSIRTDAMCEAVTDWLAYKRERRESYKPTGLKAFYGHLAASVGQHGEAAIIDRMRKAMASGWKGWDHADTRGSPAATDVPRTKSGAEILPLRG